MPTEYYMIILTNTLQQFHFKHSADWKSCRDLSVLSRAFSGTKTTSHAPPSSCLENAAHSADSCALPARDLSFALLIASVLSPRLSRPCYRRCGQKRSEGKRGHDLHPPRQNTRAGGSGENLPAGEGPARLRAPCALERKCLRSPTTTLENTLTQA